MLQQGQALGEIHHDDWPVSEIERVTAGKLCGLGAVVGLAARFGKGVG